MPGDATVWPAPSGPVGWRARNAKNWCMWPLGHVMPGDGQSVSERSAAIVAAVAAIGDAQARIALCEDTLETFDELTRRLRCALARIRAVPSDLGETCESVYNLIRRGGRMPHEGRWITRQEAATA